MWLMLSIGGNEMSKLNIVKLIVFYLIVCLLISSNLCAQSQSENFKLAADVLDASAGKATSDSCSLRVCSGGHPGVIGISKGASFYALQGYVYVATVEHGDANGDGETTISDAVCVVNYLFRGGPPPEPPESGDVNCDGVVTIADVVYIINYLFKSGPPPCNL